MTLKYFLRALALCSLSLLLFACGKEEEDETVPVLKNLVKDVPPGGGEQQLKVVATASWTLKAISDNKEVDWIHFNPASGDAGSFTVKMIVDPNTGGPRSATIVLQGPTLKRVNDIMQLAVPTVDNAPLWLELPALDKPSLYCFTHDWDGGQYINRNKSPKRNYSFYWDKENYVSHWVAYPLNDDLKSGKYGRYDNQGGTFIPDPILSNLGWVQPDISTGSYGWGTRGHQLPSADRQTEKSNISTFYVTNITPQSYNFNGQIWGSLEGAVRKYSEKSDTLYVCTGCVISSSSNKTPKYSGCFVAIPDSYYKALLRKKDNDYSAIAFLLPHTESIANEDYMDYITSVSELEAATGVTFFAALSSYVGEAQVSAIKSANPNTVVSNWLK